MEMNFSPCKRTSCPASPFPSPGHIWMTLGGQEVDYLWPLVLALGCNTHPDPRLPDVLVLQQLSVHC